MHPRELTAPWRSAVCVRARTRANVSNPHTTAQVHLFRAAVECEARPVPAAHDAALLPRRPRHVDADGRCLPCELRDVRADHGFTPCTRTCHRCLCALVSVTSHSATVTVCVHCVSIFCVSVWHRYVLPTRAYKPRRATEGPWKGVSSLVPSEAASEMARAREGGVVSALEHWWRHGG